jgi:hypothetical protein
MVIGIPAPGPFVGGDDLIEFRASSGQTILIGQAIAENRASSPAKILDAVLAAHRLKHAASAIIEARRPLRYSCVDARSDVGAPSPQPTNPDRDDSARREDPRAPHF